MPVKSDQSFGLKDESHAFPDLGCLQHAEIFVVVALRAHLARHPGYISEHVSVIGSLIPDVTYVGINECCRIEVGALTGDEGIKVTGAVVCAGKLLRWVAAVVERVLESWRAGCAAEGERLA